MRLFASLLRVLGVSTGVGARGERVAARHLRKLDYRILGRNLRNRFGEIDIVAEAPDRKTIVVVEVKTSEGGPVRPEVRVNLRKQRQLVALAVQLARRHRFHDRPIRFDVVGVELAPGSEPVVRHHVGAFQSHV